MGSPRHDPAFDIAVSPRNPNEIIATTDAGLSHSSDQGRRFTPIGAVPTLVFLSWPEEGPLVGVDPRCGQVPDRRKVVVPSNVSPLLVER
jgi:hypothetical protein